MSYGEDPPCYGPTDSRHGMIHVDTGECWCEYNVRIQRMKLALLAQVGVHRYLRSEVIVPRPTIPWHPITVALVFASLSFLFFVGAMAGR